MTVGCESQVAFGKDEIKWGPILMAQIGPWLIFGFHSISACAGR